ncbi:MAG: hypothetical protein WD185_00380, partial [Sneathiella sp.]
AIWRSVIAGIIYPDAEKSICGYLSILPELLQILLVSDQSGSSQQVIYYFCETRCEEKAGRNFKKGLIYANDYHY